MKGIIFDFNGTMFQDSHLHEEAWIHMVKKYSTSEITDEDILHNIHGRTNKEILTYFISEELTNENIADLSEEKEEFYRQLCLNHPDQLKLTTGLIPTLNKLKETAIPITIATATVEKNVDFYFEIFHLDQWFDRTLVVFDDGSFPGKPAPDIFLIAAKKLSLAPEECVVIEDAFSGLTAAKKAKIGKVIAIDAFGKNKQTFIEANLCEDGLIQDFTNIFSLLEEKMPTL